MTAQTEDHPIRQCYISTGALGVFHTLRTFRAAGGYSIDNYMKKLYLDLDRSIEAAKEFAARTGMEFAGVYDEPWTAFGEGVKRIRKNNEFQWVDYVNTGVMPWGKYKEVAFDEVPGGYLKFIVEKMDEMDFMSDEFRTFFKSVLQEYVNNYEAWVAEEKALADGSEHVGTIGERVKNVVVTISNVREIGHYDGYFVVSMRDANKNKLVYFGSGAVANYKRGDEVVISATVKRHDEFKGEKQTIVGRVMVAKGA